LIIVSVVGLTACGGEEAKQKVNFIVDGETYATINTSGNEIIQMPEDPVKDGYEFDGWYWDKNSWTQPFTANSLLNAPLSSDMKVYAKWEKIEQSSPDTPPVDNPSDTPDLPPTDTPGTPHTLTFNTLAFDGANAYGKVANSVEVFSFLTEITTSSSVRYNVSFDILGNEKIESKTLPLVVGDNVVYVTKLVNNEVVAIYKATIRRRPKYTVTFNTNGGTPVESQTIEEDSFASVPTPSSKVGYTFNGWAHDFSTPITSNTTINAKWLAKQYSITLVFDNGSENRVITKDCGTAIESVDNPTKVGHTFTGWSESIPSVMPAENKTITANWKVNQHTITKVLDNG
jgi:uncharacterized repeat protein (TIGR02543 family)